MVCTVCAADDNICVRVSINRPKGSDDTPYTPQAPPARLHASYALSPSASRGRGRRRPVSRCGTPWEHRRAQQEPVPRVRAEAGTACALGRGACVQSAARHASRLRQRPSREDWAQPPGTEHGASVSKPHGPALRTDRVARRVRRPALCASRRSAWRHRASAAGSDGGTRRTKATSLHACTQWYPVGAAPLLRSYRSAAMRRQVRSTTVVVATCVEETGQNEPVERETRR